MFPERAAWKFSRKHLQFCNDTTTGLWYTLGQQKHEKETPL